MSDSELKWTPLMFELPNAPGRPWCLSCPMLLLPSLSSPPPPQTEFPTGTGSSFSTLFPILYNVIHISFILILLSVTVVFQYLFLPIFVTYWLILTHMNNVWKLLSLIFEQFSVLHQARIRGNRRERWRCKRRWRREIVRENNGKREKEAEWETLRLPLGVCKCETLEWTLEWSLGWLL